MSAGSRAARTVAVYAGGLTVAGAVAWLSFQRGSTLETGSPGRLRPPAGDQLTWRFLLVVSLVAIVTLTLGHLARRMGQPRVVGEIVGGILLGPTFFGAVAPSASRSLLAPEVVSLVGQLGSLGLVLFMVLIGLELNLGQLRRLSHLTLVVSHGSIAVPFSLGVVLALVLYPRYGAGAVAFIPFALFMGLAMSVTAFPVLASILAERSLGGSSLATVALACAAFDDVTAWCLLVVAVSIAHAGGLAQAALTAVAAAVFAAVLLTAGRAALTAAVRALERSSDVGPVWLILLFVGVLLSALTTERIGLHMAFGAFLFGAALPRGRLLVEALVDRLQHVTALFLPLFFAASGLRTDLGTLWRDTSLLAMGALVLIVAIGGKWGGASLSARAMGLAWRDAIRLGLLMNCRGLTELVVLNIGLDLGILPRPVFGMLVLMALVTTAMTGPLLSVAGISLPFGRRAASSAQP